MESVNVPTLIKDFCKYQITDIKFGRTHSTIINRHGWIYTNGNNSEGQLGCGNTKPREAATIVKGFGDGGMASVSILFKHLINCFSQIFTRRIIQA